MLWNLPSTIVDYPSRLAGKYRHYIARQFRPNVALELPGVFGPNTSAFLDWNPEVMVLTSTVIVRHNYLVPRGEKAGLFCPQSADRSKTKCGIWIPHHPEAEIRFRKI
jgi:hypothetical protein